MQPAFLKERTYKCENVMRYLSFKIHVIPRETESNKCDIIFKPSGKIWGAIDQEVSLPCRGKYGNYNKI